MGKTHAFLRTKNTLQMQCKAVRFIFNRNFPIQKLNNACLKKWNIVCKYILTLMSWYYIDQYELPFGPTFLFCDFALCHYLHSHFLFFSPLHNGWELRRYFLPFVQPHVDTMSSGEIRLGPTRSKNWFKLLFFNQLLRLNLYLAWKNSYIKRISKIKPNDNIFYNSNS